LVVVAVVEVRPMDLVTHPLVQILVLVLSVDLVVVEVADFKQMVHKQPPLFPILVVEVVEVDGNLIR
jgi:hypothetical protein